MRSKDMNEIFVWLYLESQYELRHQGTISELPKDFGGTLLIIIKIFQDHNANFLNVLNSPKN